MSIVLKDLSKKFQNNLVVNRVSMTVADGELFVLLGASGSGKSTILRMIAGLTRPDSGTIELNGKDVTRLPPQQRGTGFVFQNYSLFRHMTVAENVEFGLKVRKTSAAERRSRRDELLDLVGLVPGEPFPALSGGQQQELHSPALAYRPAVLLLTNLWRTGCKLQPVTQEPERYSPELNLTTILVNMIGKRPLNWRTVLSHRRGNLIEVGTAEDLYHRPRRNSPQICRRQERSDRSIRKESLNSFLRCRFRAFEGSHWIHVRSIPSGNCLCAEPFPAKVLFPFSARKGQGKRFRGFFQGTLRSGTGAFECTVIGAENNI
jgi:ABC-type Fe3+/spermidine/putrescine transport system ATPase subunit